MRVLFLIGVRSLVVVRVVGVEVCVGDDDGWYCVLCDHFFGLCDDFGVWIEFECDD